MPRGRRRGRGRGRLTHTELVGGEDDSSQFQDSQQSIPAQNFGSEFVNQLRDVILETMEERLQKFKQDMGHQHQSEGEFGFGHESETHGTQQEVTQEDRTVNKVWKDVSRHNPGTFEGGRQPEIAEEWIDRLETIFQAVACNEYQKARVAILLLTGDAKRWWKSAGGMDDSMTVWPEFKEKFLEHYFPITIRHEKELEFNKLVQGNMHEDEFVATFNELSRYVTYLQYRDDPEWKHTQLIQKARPVLRPYLYARPFVSFEDSCEYLCLVARNLRSSGALGRVDNQFKSTNYLGPSGGISKSHSAGTSTSGSSGRRSQGRGFSQGYNQRGSFRSQHQGRSGHRSQFRGSRTQSLGGRSRAGASQGSHQESAVSASSVGSPCVRCGNFHAGNCWRCYYCNELGHTIRYCPKREQQIQASQSSRPVAPGRIYVTTREEAGASPNVIQGMVSIRGHSVEVLFDSGATHSFISYDCARKLGFTLSALPYDLKVTTPSGDVFKTAQVCKGLDLRYEGRDSVIDLVCLPLKGIEVIIGMDWLIANNVILLCKERAVRYAVNSLSVEGSSGSLLLSATQAEKCAWRGCQVFAVFFSIKSEEEICIDAIDVVRDYPEVFADIQGLPPEREVEFTIDLEPSASPISKAPYRMAPVELAELKKQIEELLEKCST